MSDVNVLAELERIGWKYEYASDDEIRCICPFHEDTSPSCHINTQKRLFKCQTAGCDAKGDFISFVARALQTDRKTVIADLSTRYTLLNDKTIEPDVVERAHSRIWKAGPLLKELYLRGVTDELIREYRLGEEKGRITIPVKNEGGHFVNLRKYLPGAPGRDKMRNLRGRGQIRLYPCDQMRFDTILLTAGEIKAIVAASELNAHGIGCVCATAGEGNWDARFNTAFRDKTVYTCFDIDSAGQRAVQTVLTGLHRVVDWVGNLILPLDPDKYPHGDVNDYVGIERKPLLPLLADVPEWTPKRKQEDVNEEPADVELAQAVNADYARKRVSVKAVVSAVGQAPYILPKKLRVLCDKSQNECQLCPVFAEPDDAEFEISPESDALLEMVHASRGAQRDAIMSGLGVPRTCKVVEFEATSFYNVEDARISPQLEISSRSAERVMQPAILIGDGAELNESYDLVGRMHPHPKTQESTLQISSYKATADALSTYKLNGVNELECFRPSEWTINGIQEKLDSLYEDLEANVTRIFQRRDLHLAVDLTYHSPLLIKFDGKRVKGWVETLVMGDSSQGKSDTAMGLVEHYGLGTKVECKNASVAGLLGGLQQLGTKWFVTWGIIPTNDKRLVVLEELKGTSTEVISKLTDMRSSGIAEIPKIEKRRTHARTRLLALSNPRSDKQLSAYNFGIEAVKELIGGLEDIRRFDFVLLVGSRDIDADRLNSFMRDRPVVEHKFTSHLCRELILWAWTRTDDQVEFEDPTAILDAATLICSKFSDGIPIVDKGSMRYKIARLAASLAARTFSCSDDYETLKVRQCHVEYVIEMLTRVYSSDTFGYRDYTKAVELTSTLLNPEIIKKQIKVTPWPRDFIQQMLNRQHIEIADICDWTGWDRQQAQSLLSLFVRKHALTRERRSYRKTSEFIVMLKDLLEEDLPERPEFIEEDEF